jgi:hypothetical protein
MADEVIKKVKVEQDTLPTINSLLKSMMLDIGLYLKIKTEHLTGLQ